MSRLLCPRRCILLWSRSCLLRIWLGETPRSGSVPLNLRTWSAPQSGIRSGSCGSPEPTQRVAVAHDLDPRAILTEAVLVFPERPQGGADQRDPTRACDGPLRVNGASRRDVLFPPLQAAGRAGNVQKDKRPAVTRRPEAASAARRCRTSRCLYLSRPDHAVAG